MKKLTLLFASLFLLQIANAQTVKKTGSTKSKTIEPGTIAEAENSFVQDCDKATLLQTPGKWIKEKENPSYEINPADLAKMKANLASIHNMIQQNYKPYGADAEYNNVYKGGSFKTKFPLSYSYRIFVMTYSCNGNSIKKNHETNTGIDILTNSYASLNINDEAVVGAAAADGFYSLPGHVEQHEDYLKWTEEVSLGFGMDGLQTNWLVTYNNQLPFSFVTKKEFLEKKKQIVLSARDDAKAYVKRAEHKTEEEYQDALNRMTSSYDKALIAINEALNSSESELSKSAVIKSNTENSHSFVFAKKGDKYSRTLIKPILAYFNLKIPLTAPQFFTIGLKGDQQNDISKKAMKDIEAAINFKKLKSMLGK